MKDFSISYPSSMSTMPDKPKKRMGSKMLKDALEVENFVSYLMRDFSEIKSLVVNLNTSMISSEDYY
jgi:hypothetical protein